MNEALFQPFPMAKGQRAQVWRHQPSFLRPRHFHDEPELNWIFSGRGLMGIGSRAVAVEQGDLLLLPPGLDHVLLDASPDLELFVGALDRALALRVLGQASASFHGVARLERRTREGTRETLGQLALMRDPTSYQARLAELFVQAQKATVPSHVLSRRALDGVRTEPSVSEVTLAQRLRTRPSELSRRFRKDLGVSFVEYRARVRLMRFVDGVDQGRSLGHAALDADFGSYVQCHRVFRRILGCSPTEYFAGTRAAIDALTVPAPTVG